MASLNDIETKLLNIVDLLDGSTVQTLTGALPMTFRSNGTALIDYRIYGTAEGAGVQTENLFDFQQFADGTQTTTDGGLTFTRDNDTVIVNNSSNANYPLVFLNDESGLTVPQLTQGQTYSGKIFISNAPSGSNIYVDVVGKNQGGNWTWIKDITASGNSFTLSTAYDIYGYRLVCKGTEILYENMQVKFVLTECSTIPDYFIPYGYKLPLTVVSGAESKDTDIYIGDTKLGADDYVDYESGKIVRNGTPQDPPLPLPELETFNGTNTLDSTETLGEVTIKGKIKEE